MRSDRGLKSVNFLRTLLSALVWILILAVILVIAAFVPAIQTWALGLVLDRPSGIHGTVGNVAAAFGKTEFDNLHLEFNGAEFNAPLVEAEAPILNAVGRGQFHFRHLVAKGWTLTLQPQRQDDGQVDSPDLTVARAIATLLSSGALPYDVQVDTAELEGDILIAAPKGKSPGRIHVILNGGGLAPGHQGDFAINASGSLADPNFPLFTVSTDGHLLVTLETSRLLSRIELKAGLSAKGFSLQQDLQLVGDFAASRTTDSVVYSVDLTSRGRRFLNLLAHLAEKSGQITGTWKVDLRETDFALFTGDRELPVGSAAGEGRFQADPAKALFQTTGALKIAARRLETLDPVLERVGNLSLDTTFDLTHRGHSLRVAQFAVTATGTHPLATAKILQPFDVDETTWEFKATQPKSDWASGSVQGIPMVWLTTGIAHDVSLTGGDVAGTWIAGPAPGGFRLKSVSPATSSGITLLWNGKPALQGLDFSVLGSATHTDAGWEMKWAPLTISSAGAVLGHLTANFSPGGADESMNKVAGKWDFDLPALLPHVAPEAREWLAAARSATADYTGSVGSGWILDNNLSVVGAAPDTTLTAAVHTEIGLDGSSNFNVPFKFKEGTVQSDLTVEGSWSGVLSGSRLRLKLFGGTVVAEQMKGMAGWWAQRLMPSGPPGAGVPLWGAGRGSVLFSCDHFMLQNQEYKDVSGNLEYDPSGLQLEDGHVRFGNNNVTDATAKLSFSPAAPVPYELKASAPLGDVEAKTFLPPPAHGEDPQIEGKFTVKAALASTGRNQAELLQNLQEVFSLNSKSGIVRFLKISVADVIPQHGSNVGDTLGGVGNKVGSLLGMQGKIGSGKNPVTPAAQTMVDFSYDVAEIGYDQFTMTAIRDSNGTIELKDLKLVSPDVTLSGSGSIAAQTGKPLTSWPLTLDWSLSFHGHPAELLAKDGLIVYKKDAPGYVVLDPRIHVGGTLEHPDLKQWHDILAKAASATPAKPAK